MKSLRQSWAVIVAMICTKGQLCPVLCHWAFASYWSLLWVTDCLVHWFSLNVQLSGGRVRRISVTVLNQPESLLISVVCSSISCWFVWWMKGCLVILADGPIWLTIEDSMCGQLDVWLVIGWEKWLGECIIDCLVGHWLMAVWVSK